MRVGDLHLTRISDPIAAVANGRDEQRRNHFVVEAFDRPFPQGSSSLATLGFGPESLWDSSPDFGLGDPCKVQSGTNLRFDPAEVSCSGFERGFRDFRPSCESGIIRGRFQ